MVQLMDAQGALLIDLMGAKPSNFLRILRVQELESGGIRTCPPRMGGCVPQRLP
jgi:hypothetical protein